jgi:hypothetical protein
MFDERTRPDLHIAERRQHLRYADSARVLFLEAVGSEPTAGRLRDLSQGGACLVASRAVDVGAKVYLGIFFQHLQDGPLIILARVQHCSPAEGSFALGLEFLRETNTQRNAFRRVRQHLADRYGE